MYFLFIIFKIINKKEYRIILIIPYAFRGEINFIWLSFFWGANHSGDSSSNKNL